MEPRCRRSPPSICCSDRRVAVSSLHYQSLLADGVLEDVHRPTGLHQVAVDRGHDDHFILHHRDAALLEQLQQAASVDENVLGVRRDTITAVCSALFVGYVLAVHRGVVAGVGRLCVTDVLPDGFELGVLLDVDLCPHGVVLNVQTVGVFIHPAPTHQISGAIPSPSGVGGKGLNAIWIICLLST